MASPVRGTSQGAARPASLSPGAVGVNGGAVSARGGRIRFTDKEEHMYFWFPLLAGLSELTFDPRPEIRCVWCGGEAGETVPSHPATSCGAQAGASAEG